MANISSVSGTLTLKAPSVEDLAKLLILQNETTANWHYNTLITNLTIPKPEKLNEFIEQLKKEPSCNTNTPEITVQFEAAGRWSYNRQSNEFFKDIFEETLTNSYLNKFANDLKPQTLEANLEYVEDESGVGFICKRSVFSFWENQQWGFKELYAENYDYTVENILDFGIAEEGHVLSLNYFKEHFDKIVTTLTENKSTDANPNKLKEHKEEIIQTIENESHRDAVFLDYGDDLLLEMFECYDSLKSYIPVIWTNK